MLQRIQLQEFCLLTPHRGIPTGGSAQTPILAHSPVLAMTRLKSPKCNILASPLN